MPNLHPYLAAILHHLNGKMVEINFGFVKTTLKQADLDVNLKNVIVGKVSDGMGDCLILDKEGTKIFLNVWQIQAIIPADDKLFIKDVYQDEHIKH